MSVFITLVTDSSCWQWKAAFAKSGYGTLRVNGKTVYAHRHSYETNKGAIDPGMQIDHLCKNKGCVNPNHLEMVTPMVNSRRSPQPVWLNGACSKGHERTPENTKPSSNGYTRCRTCARTVRNQAWVRNHK